MTELFKLYASERRRQLIKILGMHSPGDEVSVRSIARIIASVNTGKEIQHIGSDDYTSAYNNLNRNHIPKFEENGTLEFNERKKTVTVTEETMKSVKQFRNLRSAMEE